MARKEAVNTFTDGMVSDLNPINTPNTVLTDCLNGTLITYDGNEFTLQNDKGNYALKNCKLPENYMPVGVKEYGDIIYIVSYNPLTNKTQIGSYPSPKTIALTTDYKYDPQYPSENTPLHYEVESLWTGDWTRKNYSDIESQLFVFYGPQENYKMNPGDEYKLFEDDNLEYYEGLKYYIINDERKLYDITEDIIKTNSIDSTIYQCINWNVPGFLAVRSYIADIDDLRINVRKVRVPSFNTANDKIETLILNIQVITSDKLFENLNNPPFSFTYNIGNSVSNPTVTSWKKRNLNNGRYCYYIDCTFNNIIASSGLVELTITPYIEYNGKTIVYDKYIKTLSFNLSVKGDPRSFDLGNEIFKYDVDNEKITLIFDTSGVEESVVWDDDVYLLYSIENFGSGTPYAILDSNGNGITRKVYNGWNITGISDDLTIPFVEYPTDSIPVGNDYKKFYCENFYTIKFEFSNTMTPLSDANILKTITKTILASELLSNFDSKKYDEIYFDQWVEKYVDCIKNKKLEVQSTIVNNTISADTEPSFSSAYSVWHDGCSLSNYPKLVETIKYEDGRMDRGFTVSAGINFNVDLNYTQNIQIPRGPLWQSLTSKLKISELSNTFNFTPLTGTVTFPTGTKSTISTKVSKAHSYRFVQQTDNESVFSYIIRDLKIPLSYPDMVVTGLYEDKLTSGDANPDIEVTPPEGTKVRFTKSTANCDNTSNEAVKQISKLIGREEKYPYDVLFLTVRMPIQVEGDPLQRKNDLKLCGGGIIVTGNEYKEPGSTWNNQTVSGEIFAAADEDTAADDTFYIVFKVHAVSGSKLWFVPIKVSDAGMAYDKFTNYVNHVKFFSGNDDSIIGAYYTAERIPSNDTNYTITAKTITSCIQRSSWYYIGQNLLSEQGRQNLQNNTDSKFFTLSKGSYSTLSDIELEPFKLSFEYSGDLSSLDSIISDGDDTVTRYNTAVFSELASYRNDNLLRRFKQDYSGYYYDEAYTPNAELLRLLNDERSTANGDYFVFKVMDEWTPPGMIHYTYSSYLVMGSTDLSLYLS